MTDAQQDFVAIEALALELAQLAGAHIIASLGRTLAVRYKALGEGEEAVFRDPVSDVDHAVEVLIRAELAERFPDHGIIGEEVEETNPGADFTWIVDPVDGTANFVNGFPLFAASVGVTYRRRPVVGAVWCSTSHALRPGVYHAREGGPLYFDGQPIAAVERNQVKRRLVGLPRPTPGIGFGFEARQSGSAAIECAFVAAGLLAAAKFDAPNTWDVAGGIALVRSGGGAVLTRRPGDGDGAWEDFTSFDTTRASDSESSVWRQSLIVGGTAASAAALGDAKS